MIPDEVFTPHPQRKLHYRLSDETRQLVRVVLLLECERWGRVRSRWEAQVAHQACDDPDTLKWLYLQCDLATRYHEAYHKLLSDLNVNYYLDSDILNAMKEAGNLEPSLNEPKGGKRCM